MSNFILVTPNSTAVGLNPNLTTPGSTAPVAPVTDPKATMATPSSSALPKLLISTHWVEKAEAVAPSSDYQGGTKIKMATGVDPILFVAETLDMLVTARSK